eukprot:m.53097 g.53097  ORF g.53097 m.53097 type:complete len:64 (+) comp11353_c0_seq4:40-231(+)
MRVIATDCRKGAFTVRGSVEVGTRGGQEPRSLSCESLVGVLVHTSLPLDLIGSHGVNVEQWVE